MDDLRAFVRDIPDFPKPGIVFKDITPLLLEPASLDLAVASLAACGRSEAPAPANGSARAQQTFSGDATSDLLFRRNDGVLSVWTVDGATRTGSAVLGDLLLQMKPQLIA